MTAAHSTAQLRPRSTHVHRASGARSAATPDAPERRRPDSPQRTTGLCTTCDRRLECAFPLPEGGVWFCEEFA